MRKTTWMAVAAAGLVLAATAAEAQTYRRYGGDNALRFRVGMLTPDGESAYWIDNEAVFTGEADDFEDIVVGGDFRFGMGERLGVMISGDLWEGQEDQAYIIPGFRDVFHTTTVDVGSLTAGLVFNLLPRDASLVPYVGAGGGFYFWTLTEEGEFVDFFDPAGEVVFFDLFEDEGEALGWYGLVGLEVPVGAQWGLFAEGRWRNVEDELGGDFAGFGDLDLSGRELYLGASWSF